MGYATDWDWPHVHDQEDHILLESSGIISVENLQRHMLEISIKSNICYAARKYLKKQAALKQIAELEENRKEWEDDLQHIADERTGNIISRVQDIFNIPNYATILMRLSDGRFGLEGIELARILKELQHL